MPNLLVPGFPRCGSTSLYRYLIQHPLIERSLWKEIHYYDKEENFRRGSNWYRAHFATRFRLDALERQHGHKAYTLDATPDYLYRATRLATLASHMPDAKILILIRNPIDRAFSNFQNKLRKTATTATFEELVTSEIEFLEKNFDRNQLGLEEKTGLTSFLRRGIYIAQIERLHRYYPREQTMVIRSEDLFEDTQGSYDEILRFLELPRFQLRKTKARNVLRYSEDIRRETREQLAKFFTPFNDELSRYLGRDLLWT
jgi:hypothetical protein